MIHWIRFDDPGHDQVKTKSFSPEMRIFSIAGCCGEHRGKGLFLFSSIQHSVRLII
jgi:hypothetical protein